MAPSRTTSTVKSESYAHMADLLASSPGSGRRDGIYPESMFRYQPQSDTFLCPDGQVMKPRRLHSVRLTWEYVTKRGVCLSCRLRKFCTRSSTGRTMRKPSRLRTCSLARTNQTIDPRSTDRDGSKPSKTDLSASDPVSPAWYWLVGELPSSFSV